MYLSKHKLAILAIILNTLVWSAAPPIFKWAMHNTPPFTLAFLRLVLASIIMLPFVRKKIFIKFEDFYKIFLLALAGITFNVGLLYYGLTLTQSINAPIIISTSPIMLMLGSFFFLREIPKPKQIIGTLISLIGVLFIILRPEDHLSLLGSILGNVYLLLAVLSFVIYTILLKKFKLHYASSTIVFWIFFIGAITLLPPFMHEVQTQHSLTTINFKGAFGIIYGAIFTSTIGYYFYNYAAHYLKADEIGIFTYLEPVATAMVAIPLLHEKITFYYLIGGFFVFLGLFIAELKLHYHPLHHLKATEDPWLESGP